MKISQTQRIINYMRQFGSITDSEAVKDLGCHRLAARIHDLKKMGYEIQDEWESDFNRFGEKTEYKRYRLADIVQDNMNHITKVD